MDSMFERVENPPIKSAKDMMRLGYGNIERLLPGNSYETSGNAGEIKNALREVEDKRIMVVRTGTGAIVPEGRELITERLSGCVCLFMRGPGFRYLAHMTPSTGLGYYYHRYENSDEYMKETMRKILAQLPPGVSPEQVSATLIVNSPNEKPDDPYGRERLTAAWGKVEQEIAGVGVKDIQRVELPLDETTVLFPPATPDTAHAIGVRVDIGEKGGYVFHPEDIVERGVALSPSAWEASRA